MLFRDVLEASYETINTLRREPDVQLLLKQLVYLMATVTCRINDAFPVRLDKDFTFLQMLLLATANIPKD
jgi:hypothetical protein